MKSAWTGSVAVDVVADELAKHVAGMGALTQRRGTEAQQSGLRCSCEGWSKNQAKNGLRPWEAFHKHVAEAVLLRLFSGEIS